ncbi:MAG: metallophosphoesterase [Gemmatimonadales bacterium]|nr:metallophosphoesterase [Gemmatimonadales bacterium]MBA3554960.1 metallophosphoesterase [Gemmatimonadales bacterium]
MPPARSAAWTACVAVAVAVACTPALEPATVAPAPMAPLDSIELALFLIGDAGSKAYDGEPVLLELSRQSDSLRPVKQFVVFLGDNVYPRGVPPVGHPNRDDAERKIAAQVLAIRKGGAQGILVPGNHDWDRQGRDGWNSIRRQDTLVRRFGGDDVRLLPEGGCPGPEVVDLAAHVRLIALDSEWWLHNDVKPFGPGAPCATRTNQEVTDSLAGALRDKGTRHAIVVTHHPLRSGGQHGGAFNLSDHIFPLRNVESWLWIPLPLIGSLYPFARTMGISNQDISGGKYQLMRRELEKVFAKHPPLAVASGHDHDLQVIRGGRPEITHAGYQLVSGAGILGHASLVRKIEGSLFEREAAGFMRLDFTRDGRVRLSVTTVVPEGERAEGESAEVFSLWLTGPGGL